VLRLDQGTARDLARAYGVGVQDVALDLVAGGVRALLASRGESVARLTPRVAIPVALPAAERHPNTRNQFGGYVVALPLGDADPHVRLSRIAAERAEATATQSVRGVTTIRAWTARFALTRALMGRQRYVQLMETFLPGPPRPIELLGARVLEVIPIQPLGRNVGLTVVASTYAGTLDLTVRADPDRFPDLDVLLAAMGREWQAMTG
jgi:diacylglycerol O-acyltransferase